MQGIYISSDIAPGSPLLQLKKDFLFEAESLISFKAIPFVWQGEGSCLFFYSKNGVKYFFEQAPKIDPEIKLAAMGRGTAKLIEAQGYQCAFTGNGNVKKIAEDFYTFAKDDTTIFVKAKQSLSSIQKLLKNKIKEGSLVVYNNLPKETISEKDHDLLIFTSPLNVQSYCEKFAIKAHQKLIAIGSRTAKALVVYTDKKIALPAESTEHGILELILKGF